MPPATILNINCGIAMLSNGGHADLYLHQTGGDQVNYTPAPTYAAKVAVYDATNNLIGTFDASEAAGTGDVLTASIAGLVNGGFVVAWTNMDSNGFGSGPAYYEVFDNNGTPVDSAGSRHHAVSADATHVGGGGIQVAALAGGGFTVVYASGSQVQALSQRDFVCTFSYGGNLTSFSRANESGIGDPSNYVNTAEGNCLLRATSPGMRIAPLPDGSFVVEEATYVYFGPNYTPLGDFIYKFTSAGLPANFASGYPQLRVNWNNGGRSFDIVGTSGGGFASVNQNQPGNYEITLFNADGTTLTTNTLQQQVYQNGGLGPKSYKAVTIAPWVSRSTYYNGPDVGTLIALTKTGNNLVVAMNSAAGFGIATYLAADGTQVGSVVNSPVSPTPGGAYLLNPRLIPLAGGQWALTYDDYSVNLTSGYATASTYEYGFAPSVAQAPTITGVSSTTANGSYNTTTVIPITVTFSAAVTVTGTPTLALNSGGSASYASGSGSSTLTFNYTVGAAQNSNDLDYSSTTALALAGGTINATTGGTAATLTLPSPGATGSLGANKALVIDTTAPTIVSINRLTPSGQTTAASSVTFRVTYSEAVTGAATNNFSVVAVNGSNIVGTVTGVTGTGSTRDVTVSITSGTGEYRLRAVN
ncbi:MAG: hypothetical protein B7Z52_00735 [Burkholderiales bacterium 12-64-5]|nr:MAG: hypothetical protein B7Z52_00735 [Burkholderiales bacterium 12-64-5]